MDGFLPCLRVYPFDWIGKHASICVCYTASAFERRRDKLKNIFATSMTSPRGVSPPSVSLPTMAHIPFRARANRKWVIIVVETCWQIGWCSGSDCDYTKVKTVSCDRLTVNCAQSHNIVCISNLLNIVHVTIFIHYLTLHQKTKTLWPVNQAESFQLQHIHPRPSKLYL